MKRLTTLALCAITLSFAGCAHRSVSLEQINQLRRQPNEQVSLAPFNWYWQQQPNAQFAEQALQQWLQKQIARNAHAQFEICICTAQASVNSMQSSEQLFSGWAQLKQWQQKFPQLAQAVVRVARVENGPVLRVKALATEPATLGAML